MIKSKEEDLKDLKNNVQIVRIKKQLESEIVNKKIENLKDLPYEEGFEEKSISTKARPIQMSPELLEHCKKEIKELKHGENEIVCAPYKIAKENDADKKIIEQNNFSNASLICLGTQLKKIEKIMLKVIRAMMVPFRPVDLDNFLLDYKLLEELKNYNLPLSFSLVFMNMMHCIYVVNVDGYWRIP